MYVTPFAMRNLPALNEAWRACWPDDPPARAIIPVTGVGLKGTNVEIMLIVARPGHGIEREVIRTEAAPPAPGHAAQGVKAGGLLFLSTQLGISAGAPARRDAAFPFLHRQVQDELRLVQEHTQSICEAAGTSIDQTVKSHLYFGDFADLAVALPVWGDAFTDGYPAGGFFETPPGTQEVPGCRVTADLIVAAP